MAGGVADALEPRHLRERADERVETASLVLPRIDVLAEQSELLRAHRDQRPRFLDDRLPTARGFRAARVGDDAIGAEFVAALLDGQEGRRPLPPPRRQRRELRPGRHVGVEAASSRRRLRDEGGKPMIGLGADDHVDAGSAAGDLLALRLRDAAGDRDHRSRAGFPLALHQPPDVRIDLLGRFFADVARVEHDEIGRLRILCGRHAVGFQQLGHPGAVIDVHLAAEALDVERARIADLHRGHIGERRLIRKRQARPRPRRARPRQAPCGRRPPPDRSVRGTSRSRGSSRRAT